MGFQDRIIQQRRERHGIADNTNVAANENFEEGFQTKFFGIENYRYFVPAFIVGLPDGKFRTIEYFNLDIRFDPSGEIEILTANSNRILIIGRNLWILYKYLSAHRVNYIQSNIGNDLVDEKEMFIKTIEIEEV